MIEYCLILDDCFCRTDYQLVGDMMVCPAYSLRAIVVIVVHARPVSKSCHCPEQGWTTTTYSTIAPMRRSVLTQNQDSNSKLHSKPSYLSFNLSICTHRSCSKKYDPIDLPLYFLDLHRTSSPDLHSIHRVAGSSGRRKGPRPRTTECWLREKRSDSVCVCVLFFSDGSFGVRPWPLFK